MKDHMVFAGLFTVCMAATLGNRWILLAVSLVFFGGWLFTFARAVRAGELRSRLAGRDLGDTVEEVREERRR